MHTWRRGEGEPRARGARAVEGLRLTACAPSTQCLRDMQNTMAGSIEGVGEERLRARRRHLLIDTGVCPPSAFQTREGTLGGGTRIRTQR